MTARNTADDYACDDLREPPQNPLGPHEKQLSTCPPAAIYHHFVCSWPHHHKRRISATTLAYQLAKRIPAARFATGNRAMKHLMYERRHINSAAEERGIIADYNT